MRKDCELELEKKQAQIKEILLELTIDEQFDHEWEKVEKDFL